MANAPLSPDVLQKLYEDGFAHLTANKYHVLASTVMLLYDHILTFEQERIYVWNQKKSFPTLLFFVFRYATPIISILNLVAEHDPRWIGAICENWIWLPVSAGPIVCAAAGVILIMRVHAIYARAQWVLYLTVFVYLAQIAAMVWSIPAGVPAQLPPGFIGCVPTEKPGTGHRLAALYIAALVFDAVVFALTFGRALFMGLSKQRSTTLLRIIVRDGTLYFMVIFLVNLVNVFLFTLGPSDLGAINAPFSTMITAILVARLVLNLREAAAKQIVHTSSAFNTEVETWPEADHTQNENTRSAIVFHRRKPSENAVTSFVGLGEFDIPLGGFDYDFDMTQTRYDGPHNDTTLHNPHHEAYELSDSRDSSSVIPRTVTPNNVLHF